MQIPRRIYVVGSADYYANWMQGTIVPTLEEADLVVFTGGEDVSPFIYNRGVNPKTSVNYERDMKEVQFFQMAVDKGKHIIGICRGAQLICACAGGILVQHQANPKMFHPMKHIFGPGEIIVTSTHHQAQYPWLMKAPDFQLIGWTEGISPYHEGSTVAEELVIGEVKDDREAEIVFYPQQKALAIQSHPEMMHNRPGGEIAKSMGFMRGLLNMHMTNILGSTIEAAKKQPDPAPQSP